MRRAGKRMTVDQALHGQMSQKRKGGRGPQILSKWRDKFEQTSKGKVAFVDVLLASNEAFTRYWQHQIPTVIEFKDKKTKKPVAHIWGREWMCLESEDVLDKRFYRDDDGEREAPPEVCPICLLNEHVRKMIMAGDLDPAEELFRFEHRGAEETVVLTAGGICNWWDRDFWTELGEREESKDEEISAAAERERKALKRVNITGKEAFKQSIEPGAKYLIQVVDYEHPESGCQITREAKSLGDKLETALEHEYESRGEKGHPIKHPYVIRFKYMPDEGWDNKYDVVPLLGEEYEATEEMIKLVQEGPFQDTGKLLEFGNVKTLRVWLERSMVSNAEIPWDDIFGPSEKICDANGIPQIGEEEEASDESSQDAGEDGDDGDPLGDHGDAEGESAEDIAASLQGGEAPPSETDEEGEVETAPCDGCGKAFAITATKCPHCGKEYDVVDTQSENLAEDEEKKPEPKAETKAEKPAVASKGKGGGKGKAPAKAAGDGKFKI